MPESRILNEDFSNKSTSAALQLIGQRYAVKAIRVSYMNDSGPREKEDQLTDTQEWDLSKIISVAKDLASNIPQEYLYMKNFIQKAQTMLKSGESILDKIEAFEISRHFDSEKMQNVVRNVLDFISQRQRRHAENEEDASLVGLIYIDMFLRLSGQSKSLNCICNYFCLTSKAAKKISPMADKMSIYLSKFASELLAQKYNDLDSGFLDYVTSSAKSESFDCEKKFPGC